MKRYIFRKYRSENGVFKTWQYDYIEVDGTELPKAPAGFTLFTITKL
jgi:hypothetical protein